MTGKERAQFRAQANSLEPEFQIGKGGISDGVVKQTLDAFNTKELIKVKVLLESSPETPRETADKLAAATGCEVIQIIGGVIVLYKKIESLAEGKKKKTAKQAKKGKPLSKVRAKREANEKRIAREKLSKRDFYAKKRQNNK
jgi:RNA-binding protein